MIQIRKGQFETNSSSCHVFVYKDDNVVVPKIVTFIPNNNDTIRDTFFNDYYIYYQYNPNSKYDIEDMKEFICKVLMTGVEDIRCSDKRIEQLTEEVKNDIKNGMDTSRYCRNREAFKHILFDENVKITTMEDFMVCPEEIEKEFGKGYNYLAHRLS